VADQGLIRHFRPVMEERSAYKARRLWMAAEQRVIAAAISR
jgi:hypothetical protein